MSRVLKTAALLLLVAGGLLFLPSVRNAALPPVAECLDIDESPECSASVLILPGDESRRALTAAALVRIGLAQQVLIPKNRETADVKDGITLPTAQISRRILLHRGIPDDRIVLLPSESRTTFDDARALADFLRGQVAKVTVVTSAFHTRRARFVFDKVLGDAADRIRFVSAPNPGFTTTDWWKSRSGLQLILTEYLKLGFYYVRYGDRIALVACGVCLLAIVGWRMRVNSKTLKKTAAGND